ncbi:hypothetical protein QPK24_09820 [Paenibacillus polygoni]|uniref:Tetrahydromethanopterin S-methyltransferase n=1 Tax=Paenibacillus polygoni TaxID=3050112 RepID=A0ABY8X7A7_9BACL|nr:hypothetical protein [Paenibacillus polygoni]WIV20938.1 hypothetical protein QPK24_09820 [Paenibacillus polygoni]
MSEGLNEELLKELKEINKKLDDMSSPRGLSGSLKVVALVFGFVVIGPILLVIMGILFSLL